eukprot:346032_1
MATMLSTCRQEPEIRNYLKTAATLLEWLNRFHQTMMRLFWIQFAFALSAAMNDINSIQTKMQDTGGAGSDNTLTITLWYNSTIYQYSVHGTQRDTTYQQSIATLSILHSSDCYTFAAKVMLESDGDDAAFIDKISFYTASGLWYGIDAVCRDTIQPNGLFYQDNSVCEPGLYYHAVIGIDKDDPQGFPPHKQLIYFDMSRPNQFIPNALLVDGIDVDPVQETCNPTSSPTDRPTLVPTKTPTPSPTKLPIMIPTMNPSINPTIGPTTPSPTQPGALLCGEDRVGTYSGDALIFEMTMPFAGTVLFDASGSQFAVSSLDAFITVSGALVASDLDHDGIVTLQRDAGEFTFIVKGDVSTSSIFHIKLRCVSDAPTSYPSQLPWTPTWAHILTTETTQTEAIVLFTDTNGVYSNDTDPSPRMTVFVLCILIICLFIHSVGFCICLLCVYRKRQSKTDAIELTKQETGTILQEPPIHAMRSRGEGSGEGRQSGWTRIVSEGVPRVVPEDLPIKKGIETQCDPHVYAKLIQSKASQVEDEEENDDDLLIYLQGTKRCDIEHDLDHIKPEDDEDDNDNYNNLYGKPKESQGTNGEEDDKDGDDDEDDADHNNLYGKPKALQGTNGDKPNTSQETKGKDIEIDGP